MTADPATQIERDGSLVREILAGRRDRYAELIRRFQGRIYALTSAYTRNPEEARDLTQEIFIATWESLPRFDQARSFTNWILKITTHHCYQYLRRRNRPTPPPEPDPGLPDPLDIQVLAEGREKVRAAFLALDDEMKAVVWLYYFLDRSCKEIAEILDISLDLVKIRLFRARKSMGKQLAVSWPEAGPGEMVTAR